MSRGKELSARLAAWLATPAGLRAARRLQAAGGLDDFRAGPSAGAPGAAPAPGRRLPEPIAVWQPAEDERGRLFVRPDPHPLGDHHAARKVLRPKTAELPLRVCLFGESVAAGYLYAPHLTPAQVLEGQLRAALGSADVEVVDLARTDETLPSLAATVRAALQINPDVLVLFTGNNWNLLETPEVSQYAPSVRARLRYAERLRGEGLGGPVHLAREGVRRAAEAAFELIATIARAVGIPVVVVVPEVNLADWETRQPVTHLPGDGVAAWYDLYRRAGAHLARGEPAAAADAAEGLLALDGGACPTSWRLRGRARAALGAAAEARADLLAEVDAAHYATMAFLGAPQATTAARELLRELAARHGFACVDLREVFARHLDGALPGRRLFLDYCHLTREGMQVAMAAAAAEVLRLSGMAATDEEWPSLLARLPAPAVAPAADAAAMLGAAIHSAHRLLAAGAKGPILEHWLDAALDASPGAEVALLDLLEARCAPCPAVLTPAQRRNLASSCRLTLQHGWRWDHLDADLLAAAVAVLERRGTPARALATRLLLAHHAPRAEGTDLADPFYLWEPLERFFPDVMDYDDLDRRATYRAPWPVSSFCLVGDGRQDVELELTARRPGPATPAAVTVNGRPAGALPMGETWTRGTLRLPAASLRPGLNRLDVAWPPPPAADADPFRSACERLELGLAADLHPVFAEVWSLLARPR